MRTEVVQHIRSDKDLQRYIREQPYWYRKLSRDPGLMDQFEVASIHYFKKTIPHHVERFSQGVQMASMMMGMMQSLKN